MLSHLQLRHILESAFLPAKCTCEIDTKGIMTVQFINPRTHKVDLRVAGINTSKLSSSRAIAALISDLKHQHGHAAVALPDRRLHRR